MEGERSRGRGLGGIISPEGCGKGRWYRRNTPLVNELQEAGSKYGEWVYRKFEVIWRWGVGDVAELYA